MQVSLKKWSIFVYYSQIDRTIMHGFYMELSWPYKFCKILVICMWQFKFWYFSYYCSWTSFYKHKVFSISGRFCILRMEDKSFKTKSKVFTNDFFIAKLSPSHRENRLKNIFRFFAPSKQILAKIKKVKVVPNWPK